MAPTPPQKGGTKSEAPNTKQEEPVTEEKETYQPSIESIGAQPESIAKYVPKDDLVLDTAIGDLNLDGINDVLLVIRSKWEDTIGYPADDGVDLKRPILILLGQPDGSYTQVAKNDSAIMCINCSGIARSDPFTGLKIKNGYFSIEHGVAEGPQHWETVTTFKYDKEQKQWFLFKDGMNSYKLNPNNDPDADAMTKENGTLRTKKDFGVVPFEKYKLDE